MLEIYNNLHKRKEPFQPIDPGDVRMYVCGMTVYDYCHLGHARVLTVFDVVYRYLRELYGAEHVTYIRNITDIDDKILKRATENNESFTALTERFIAAMHEDVDALGLLPPNGEPRATRHIDEILTMIQALVDKGYAYAAANGDVYYAVSRFESYGALSGKQLDELRAGARVEVEEAKDDPLDFVLWKAAKPGEPSWESPWGPGRPGWHIECSAMSTHCLGNHFDIHGGGLDLQFPHHENEIAQSVGATGEKFVNVWMHNGFVRVDEEKMSKSLGNFFTIREVLAYLGGERDRRRSGEIVRFFLVLSHYRRPLNYSDGSLDNAKAGLTRLYIALNTLDEALAGRAPEPVGGGEGEAYRRRFAQAMDDDFNTAVAVSVLQQAAGEINRALDAQDTHRAAALGGVLRELGGILGLLGLPPKAFLQGGHKAIAPDAAELKPTGHPPAVPAGLSEAQIETLIAQRVEARRNRDYAEADRIRDALEAQGIILEDGAQGTSWRRA